MTTFQERLQFEREKKGWTKTLTAEKLGVKNLSRYSNWEYGLNEPDMQMISNIATLFDVTTDYLITGTDCINTTSIPKDEMELLLNFNKLDTTQQQIVTSLIDSYLPKKGKSSNLVTGEDAATIETA